ncbi:DUF397 domain-containing protein [Catenulispora sp. NF23]|uniref:DUF397 domain-containing protein n=1 Tax=Catenulispora pinistramenti TaxID=2705254 RepID=UPI001BA4D772|nr:DUF397 domain-containing protein [Catenulispora pinistramenti]MBS2533267.1 DUF397 domain-containing protein [Catenulispora pinistramenti]
MSNREEALNWRKATQSGNNGGQCVEVATLPDGGRAVRDSKDPDGARLRFTAAEWAAFLDGAKSGEFDQ